MSGLAQRARVTAALIITVAVLNGCGGSSGGSSTDASKLACNEPATAGLGSDPVCVDSGVRASDLFTFSNWAGHRYEADDFGFTEMISLYGAQKVCGTTEVTTCVPVPKAKVIRSLLAAMLKNGRCEGLSVLAAMYMTGTGPDPKKFDASDVKSLNPRNSNLNDVIDYMWSTQLMKQYIDYAKSIRKGGVARVLTEVVDGLTNKTGVTVGIYQNNAGHSIVPVALARHSKSEYYVYVWDSNHPTRLGRLVLDIEKHTWTYSGGQTNPNETAKVWSGTDGQIDAGTLKSRKGEAVVNISSSKGSSTVVATAAEGKTLSVTVTTKDGEKLVAASTGVTGVIKGASVQPSKNGDATQLIIELPASAGEFSASASITGDNAQQTVANDLIAINPSVGNPVSVVVAAAGSSTTAVTVSATDGAIVNSTAAATISTSTNTSAIQLATTANETAQIASAKGTNGDVAVTLTSSTGQQTKTTIAAPTSGFQDVALTSSGDGLLKKTTTTATPVVVSKPVVNAVTTTTVAENQTTSDAKSNSSIENIYSNSAMVTSKIFTSSDATYLVEYGRTDSTTTLKTFLQSIVATMAGSSTITAKLANLDASTEYRYRTILRIAGVPIYSTWATFKTAEFSNSSSSDDVTTTVATSTTLPSPVVSTPDATINVKAGVMSSDVTASTARILSRVATPTSSIAYYIEYAIDNGDPLSSIDIRKFSVSGGYVDVDTTLSNLQPNTRYRMRNVLVGPGNSFTWRSQYFYFVTDPVAPQNVVLNGADSAITVTWAMPANPSNESLSFTATADDGSSCTVVDAPTCDITSLTRFQSYEVSVSTTVVSTGSVSARSTRRSAFAAAPFIQSFGARPNSDGFAYRMAFVSAGYTYSYGIQIRLAGSITLLATAPGNNGQEVDPDTFIYCSPGPSGVYCTTGESVSGLDSEIEYEIRVVVSANNTTYRSNWEPITTL